MMQIIRGGDTIEVHVDDIVVGDVICIQTGVVLPADGILFSGFNISADESTMTGEPHAVEKDVEKDPFLLSGTNVVNGIGKMMVIGTGVNSLNGRSLLALEVEPEDTPLQQKVERLADIIARIAVILAVTMVIVLLVAYFVVNPGINDSYKISQDLLQLLIMAVTIVVVAVPEGLPLAVTLSLANATLQMLKDNNLVRNLASCETMGNATTICSDKTGTLTMNKMSVVEGILMGHKLDRKNIESFAQQVTEGSKALKLILDFVAQSLNVNSSAGESRNAAGEVVINGSKTEIAILDFWTKLGYPYQADRKRTEVVNMVPFSSERKRMTCVAKIKVDQDLQEALGLKPSDVADREFVFVKGASEIVLRGCSMILTNTGRIVDMTPELHEQYQKVISNYAEEALRTVCCAIKPIYPGESYFDSDGAIADSSDLVLVMLFGILDPLRNEVPAAVAKCQMAGITVRMVTGDSAPTARAIARGCGILSADGIIMEGPDFRKMTQEQMDETLPKLQVLARSSPLDKQILVMNLKRLGETVAVTGGIFC